MLLKVHRNVFIFQFIQFGRNLLRCRFTGSAICDVVSDFAKGCLSGLKLLLENCSKIKELEEDIVPFAVALGAVGGTAEAALWTYSGGGDYFKDGEWVIDSDTNVIEVAVRRLRVKVDDPFEPKLIHTVRGMGYVLEAMEPI